jgi:hypothetical protein
LESGNRRTKTSGAEESPQLGQVFYGVRIAATGEGLSAPVLVSDFLVAKIAAEHPAARPASRSSISIRGLGPRGYAEPIIHRRRDDPGLVRTRSWIGAAATSIYGGGSISTEIHGDGLSAIQALLSKAVVDAVALECGVLPVDKVGATLRADNWLHIHGDPNAPEAAGIKKLIREAFHSDALVWQGMALGQGLAACRAALGGLSLPLD